MKIKLSKSQWELVGKKAGWMKKADNSNVDAQVVQAIENFCRSHNLIQAASPVISEKSIELIYNQKNNQLAQELFHDFRNEINWLALGRLLSLKNNKNGDSFSGIGMKKEDSPINAQ